MGLVPEINIDWLIDILLPLTPSWHMDRWANETLFFCSAHTCACIVVWAMSMSLQQKRRNFLMIAQTPFSRFYDAVQVLIMRFRV